MTNHQRDAASDDSNERADVQKGDDSVVVAAQCFRVHVQQVAAIEHCQREDNRHNTKPEYHPSINTPPHIDIRRLLLRRIAWIRRHDGLRDQRVALRQNGRGHPAGKPAPMSAANAPR